MKPIQVFLVCVVFGVIWKTFQKYKGGAITVREFVLWLVFWFIVGTLVVFPDATQTVASSVGIGRGVDLVIYLAIISLFVGLFFVLTRIERLERDVTKIVRKMALEELNKGQKKLQEAK
jgi:hypothetical protein